MDQTPRYAPTSVICKGMTVPVTSWRSYPPGEHPEGCPLVADCTALELRTSRGSRWYGVEKAWINSELRMVISGTHPNDTVRMRWPVCTTR